MILGLSSIQSSPLSSPLGHSVPTCYLWENVTTELRTWLWVYMSRLKRWTTGIELYDMYTLKLKWQPASLCFMLPYEYISACRRIDGCYRKVMQVVHYATQNIKQQDLIILKNSNYEIWLTSTTEYWFALKGVIWVFTWYDPAEHATGDRYLCHVVIYVVLITCSI